MILGKQIGATEDYLGHDVQVTFYQPDFLCYVNAQQIGCYWIDLPSAHKGARRHIDQVKAEQAEKRKRA
jgi:hypothetical protein